MQEELTILISLKPINRMEPEDLEGTDYYNRVVRFIQILGSKTEIEGHSPLMDEMKNLAYKCIGL